MRKNNWNIFLKVIIAVASAIAMGNRRSGITLTVSRSFRLK
ncbi:smalltalk protein [Bacteroides fragilis]|nr:smalltalk protein [Bacteroides fragilis]